MELLHENCEKCELWKNCKHPFMGGRIIGNKDNIRVILIGEAPGASEDMVGIPFVGRSGRLLEDTLNNIFDDNIGIYITNAVKCKPVNKKNGKIRTPTDNEIMLCKPNLIDELSQFDSSTIIVTLGNSPLYSLKRIKNITKYIGKVFDIKIDKKIFKLVPNYHPAYILRSKKIDEFALVFDSIYNYIDGDDVSINYKILPPNKAIELLDNIAEDQSIEYAYIDIESSSLITKYQDPLVLGMSITHDNTDDNYYIPFHTYLFDEFDITPNDRNNLKKSIKKLFSAKPVIGHNVKYDILQLLYDGYIDEFTIKADTYILAHIVYNRRINSLTLKNLARTFFSVFEDWDKEIDKIIESNPKDKKSYRYIPTDILGKYCCIDIYYTKKLYHKIMDDMDDKYKLMATMYNLIESEVIMWELHGIPIDFGFLEKSKAKIEKMISDELSKLISIPEVVKYMKDNNVSEININSPKIKDIMFKYMKFPIISNTDTGAPSVTKNEISKYLSDKNLNDSQRQFIESLVSLRDLYKHKDSYIDVIPEHKDTISNRCRFTFKLCGTVTGRISSPIHSLPSRGSKAELKRLIIPSDGNIIIALDYSQLEPRVMASISGEKALIDAYRAGLDIYKYIGSRIYGVNPDEIDKSTRQRMKAILLGMIYGKTYHSLSKDLDISEDDAKQLINEFFMSFPNVKEWIDNQHKLVFKYKGIYTALGRFIPIHEVFTNKEEAMRKAQNYPIQSSASELALYNFAVFSKILRSRYKSNVILSVHDSLVIDTNPFEIINVLDSIELYLEKLPIKKFKFLKTPLVCDISIGTSWGGKLELEKRNNNIIIASGYEEDFNKLCNVIKPSNVKILNEYEKPNESAIFPYENYNYVRILLTI